MENQIIDHDRNYFLESIALEIGQQSNSIDEQTRAIQEQTKVLSRLADQIEALVDKPTLADVTCDFTQWNIVEAISNLELTLRSKS